MIYQIKKIIRKMTPRFVISIYHLLLSWIGAMLYGFPSRKIIVIGITGTKGKTTIAEMLNSILEEFNLKTAMINSLRFKIGEEEWANKTKMTMPGRFFIQKFIRRAVRSNCKYLILEATSIGMDQHRHRAIDFDVVLFNNIHPEHLEEHNNSFEKYLFAKEKLFKKLESTKKTFLYNDRRGKMNNFQIKTSILNLDDKFANNFLKYWADKKIGYSLSSSSSSFGDNKILIVKPSDYSINSEGIIFNLDNYKFKSSLKGEFNLYNILAATSISLSLNIPLSVVKEAISKFSGVDGRMEKIENEKGKNIFVDFAHTPDSLEAVYQLLRSEISSNSNNGRLICILGGTGGGRDKWKRPVMGKIAGQYCDEIIITNEDPYDENPVDIMKDVADGLREDNKEYQIIEDRREAISTAIRICQKNDIVVITGKGAEKVMVLADNKKIPWDDRVVVREELEKFS